MNLLNNFDYERLNVDLVVVSYNGVYKTQIPDQVRVIPLFRSDFLVRVLAFFQKRVGFSALFEFQTRRKVKTAYHTAVCFLDSNFTQLLFYLNAKKKVTWVHASYRTYSNFARFYEVESYRNRLISQRYRRLDAVAFVSQDAKQEFIEVFGEYEEMPVIYNLINRREIMEKSVGYEIPIRNYFQFLAIGSLYPVKGFDNLIRAARLVKDRGYKFGLDILGDGYLKDDLNQLIKDLSLQDEVNLLGFKSNPYPILKNCDVFIMSSISEALPTVLCEAMILGKPVAATNCSGCRELVDYGKYGIMMDTSPEALADGMTKFLADKEAISYFTTRSILRSELFDEQKVLNECYRLLDLN